MGSLLTADGCVEVMAFDATLHSPAEIAEIRHEVRIWQYEQERISTSDFLKSQEDVLVLQDFYIRAGGNFFVAQDVEVSVIVGFVGILSEGDGVGQVKRMVVVPERHRQGIGTELMKTAITWARNNGFCTLTLTTGKDEQASPLYYSLGFTQVSTILGSEDQVMELDLSPE